MMIICTSHRSMLSLCFMYRRLFQYFENAKKNIYLSRTLNKRIPNKLKGRSKSSQEWLIRHLNDVYVKKSRYNNFRSRSAYKLIEINEKYKLFKPGMTVVDCGAAPGSWSQIAAKYTNANKIGNTPVGTVIALDLISVEPIDGVSILQEMDFCNPLTQKKLLQILNGNKVDIVLSDMAPNATGIKIMDHEQIITLAYAVLYFSIKVLATDGSILYKVWDGHLSSQLEMDMKKYFHLVKRIKPLASHIDSSEIYILAKYFKDMKI